MYLNDCQRAGFYATIGLDARKFDIYVIKKTNQSSARLFPLILDIENPVFFEYLDKCCKLNLELIEMEIQGNFFGKLVKISLLGYYLLRVFLLPSIDTQQDWNKIF